MRSHFVGYRRLTTDTQVAWVIPTKKASGSTLIPGPNMTLDPGDEGEVILTRTPFYPESGGQVGDTGILLDDVTSKKIAEVREVRKPHPDFIVHTVVAHKTIRPHMRLRGQVNAERRKKT